MSQPHQTTGTTRTFQITVGVTPLRALPYNPDRASFEIANQHAALALYHKSGHTDGPQVTVAGNHMGRYIGPNGGAVYDNDDKDEQWLVAAALNQNVYVTETIKSFHTVK